MLYFKISEKTQTENVFEMFQHFQKTHDIIIIRPHNNETFNEPFHAYKSRNSNKFIKDLSWDMYFFSMNNKN